MQNSYKIRRVVEMENPLTADYSILRPMLIPGLLETLGRNKHNEYPQLLFETGPVWTTDEEPRLAFVICAERGAGFTEAKQTLEALMRGLGKQMSVKPLEDRLFISGRAAVFPGGFFGEIHPQVLVNFDIPFAVAAGEIRFKEIVE
jgi:phenylalanyl-tRNA synthetase beta chain